MTTDMFHQSNRATPLQNARRYGVLGLLSGAMFGLVYGAEVFTIAKVAFAAGGASALCGMCLGNKLNFWADKAANAFFKQKQENAPVVTQGYMPVIQSGGLSEQQHNLIASASMPSYVVEETAPYKVSQGPTGGEDIADTQVLTFVETSRPLPTPTHREDVSAYRH